MGENVEEYKSRVDEFEVSMKDGNM